MVLLVVVWRRYSLARTQTELFSHQGVLGFLLSKTAFDVDKLLWNQLSFAHAVLGEESATSVMACKKLMHEHRSQTLAHAPVAKRRSFCEKPLAFWMAP